LLMKTAPWAWCCCIRAIICGVCTWGRESGIASDMETGTGTVTGIARWVGAVAYVGVGIGATWVIISTVDVVEVTTGFGLGVGFLVAGKVPFALAWQ